jgi:hypothetical protein
MHRIGSVLICIIVAVGQLQLPVSPVHASGSSTVVISHVITGETASSSSEFIAVYNNAASDIDMKGYCFKNKSSVVVACVSADSNTKVFIKSHDYLTFSSTVFASAHNYSPDTNYVSSNALQVGGDALTLLDANNSEVDKMTWGTSGGGITSNTNGTLIRKVNPAASGQLLDTDVMSSDFTSSTNSLTFPQNASYDVVTIIDVCPNIDGTQATMPLNYLADGSGNCQPDSCLNIAGLQVSVPDSYNADAVGNCTPHDECDNLSGIQSTIPVNMVRANLNDCAWDVAPLVLNELMPNAVGTDTGNEFIEIYNPTNRTIDLSLYSVKTGISSDKTYAFPIGATIAPGEYRTFSDSTMKFTLVNTSSRIVLSAIDGTTLGDSGAYDSPAEGESWALINGSWQYTNRPTPGSDNTPSVIEEQESAPDASDTGPTPCPAGKYRNQLTNRCRTIVADAAVLAACESDQYRNPDTGRCRKIDKSTLAACKDNQYRSEETNRCRTVTLASAQKPCKDNQFRSEETNRCRNLPPTTVPDAAFAVKPVKDSGMAFVGWWALGTVVLAAGGYGVWEWRRELVQLWRRLFNQ